MDEVATLITALEDHLVQGFRTCQATLELVKEERLALVRDDAGAVRASAEQIEASLDELMKVEEQNCAIVQELSRKFHLASPSPTLSEVASALHPEEGSRIKCLREGVLELACEIRELSGGNLALATATIEDVDRVAAFPKELYKQVPFSQPQRAPFINSVDGKGNRLYDTGTNNGNPTPEIILHSVGPGQKIPQHIDGNSNFSPLFPAHIAARNEYIGGDSTAIRATAGSFQEALNGARRASTANEARQNGNRLEKAQHELKSQRSQKENGNPPAAISALHNRETIVQVVLEVGNRAISAMKLFELLS